MYYPPLFAAPAGVRACFDAPAAPPTSSNPLDLSTKAVRPDSSSASHQAAADAHQAAAEELMLDHRKLAASLAAQSLLSRQLLDPASLFRLGYAPEGLAIPPFCYDGAAASRAAAVPTSLASHQLMTSLLQQQQQLREQQHQQALLAAAARNSAAAQQAAVAAAFMDPSLHLRNGMSQREAAAALAATRGLYAPAMPTPMVLPAFSLYTEDKGAFTSLRTSDKGQQSFLNGLNGSTALEAARFAEHLQRLREQHLQQHSSSKCGNSCCSGGLTATSMPCACCVQSPPSQSALCARSPMGTSSSGGKDPTTSAATGKACDFMQTGGLSFLHRSPAATTSSNSTADLRLSVSSLCTTVANSDATTTSSGMRDKHHQNSMYQSAGIWNAGLPTVSSSGKTAFSVPKKKDVVKDSSVYSKEMKPSASMKDILKDSSAIYDSRKYDLSIAKPNVPIKSETMKKEDRDVKYSREEYSSKYYKNISSAHDVKPFIFSRHTSPKSNGHMYNGNDALTTVTSVTPVVPTKCEGGTIPIARMPPLLEAVRPTDHLSFRDHFQETAVASPQGPPPLVAATNGDPAPYSSHKSPKTSYAATTPTSSSSSSMYLNPSFRHHGDKQQKTSSVQESAKPPKTAKKAHSGSQPTTSHKFGNGLPPPASFIKEEPSLALPKPIPHLPSHPYASHYRSAQHQLSLQTHNGWIPPAHPNVTVAAPASSTSAAASVTSSPTVTTTGHVKSEVPSPFFTSAAGIKREPDYPDSTPNVLQSLLIRSSHGLDPLAAPATSVITPLSGPLFGLDYRYPFGHHPLGLPKQDVYGLAGSVLPLTKDSKQEASLTAVIKTETVSPSGTSSKSSKKRSNGLVSGASTDEMAAKKRFLASDYANTVPRYSFQPPAFANEAAEAPECPYTFIAEPPLNYTGQPKFETKERSVKAEMPEKSQCHRVSAEETEIKSEEILAKPLKKPQPKSANRVQSFRMTDRARARSKLRKRLLARIYQERRPLALSCGVQDHRVTIEKEMALQHTRKLLSQISLRWSHRRYLYRWYASRRKAMEGSRLKKRGKRREGAKAKREVKAESMEEECHVEDSVSKASDNVNAIPMPSDMKRLMVNKALGETILHRAARLGYPEVVAYCLETACGNVNARDNAGYTPLHECCSRGHLDIARALLRYGADVNASAAGGIRPLHDAVENDHVEVVRLLLSYGADPSIATYSGLEPIKLARSPLMAKFLQGFLADISGEVDHRPHLDVGGGSDKSPHLPWRFWGSCSCLDPSELGYDVFEGVPSDAEGEGEGDNDFLFEVSDSPHLPTFRLLVANSSTQCNYLRLSDVLRKLSIGREEFSSSHGHIEIVLLPRHEFESGATCSQLLTGTKLDSLFTPAVAPRPSPCAGPDRFSPDRSEGDTTELVRLDNAIRRVLGIETISVR